MPWPVRLAPALMLLISTGVTARQPGARDLAEPIARFEKAKKAADEKAAKAFENGVHVAKTNKQIKENVRQDFIDKWMAAKSLHERTGRWPGDPLFGLVDDEYRYAESVGKAFASLSKEFDRHLKAAREKNDAAAVARLLGEKATVIDSAFTSRDAFTAGSTWSGLATGPKGGKTTVNLRLTAVRDATFEGVVDVDPLIVNHPAYTVNGSVDGNVLNFVKTKQLSGQGGPGQFVGYLSASRVFLLYGAGGYVVMERTGGAVKKR